MAVWDRFVPAMLFPYIGSQTLTEPASLEDFHAMEVKTHHETGECGVFQRNSKQHLADCPPRLTRHSPG